MILLTVEDASIQNNSHISHYERKDPHSLIWYTGYRAKIAAAAGCDTFVTADVRYNQFWDAQNLGINLIDAGHFHTENPVCVYLCEKIREAFPELSVSMSAWHMDCAKFFH